MGICCAKPRYVIPIVKPCEACGGQGCPYCCGGMGGGLGLGCGCGGPRFFNSMQEGDCLCKLGKYKCKCNMLR